MKVEAAKQANQNHGRQTKREADVEDDARESGAAPTAPPDLYDILGYRQSFMSVCGSDSNYISVYGLRP